MPESDSSKSLFTITEENLNKGLRGFPVGTCRTSFVDQDTGVHYVGYSMDELADKDPEDVFFLLLNKRLPNAMESKEFRGELAERAKIPDGALRIYDDMPRICHPMKWLVMGLQRLDSYGGTGDYREDALNLVARTPELLAAIFRRRSGLGELIESKPELGLVENFVHMLDMPGGNKENLTRVLRLFYVLHMDHGGGNLSTFVGKAVASGLSSLYASMASAMNALAGPRHGRASQEALEFVRYIGTSNPERVEKKVRAELAAKRPIFGFGHAVLRKEDPRARLLIEMGASLCPDDPEYQAVVTLREVVPPILKEIPKISNPYPNVDLGSGALLNAVGFFNPDYYTAFFGWSRIAGIAAQIVDERTVFSGGKGVPIYRCKYIAENQERTD